MKIGTYRWDQVALADIARVTYAARRDELEKRNITTKELKEMFQENFAEEAPSFVLATSGEALIGLLLLYRTTPTSIALNPGQILGGHPLVAPGSDARRVASGLIQEAIDWAWSEGIERVELTIPMAKDNALQSEYDTFYGGFGFGKEEEYVEMICHLAGWADQDISVPPALEIRPLRDAPVEQLYRCYHQAFSAGDASFFFQQDEREKREFFDTLGLEEAVGEKASLFFAQNRRMVGFSFVLPYGEGNCHISCMCIHPDFMSQGLGKSLLQLIKKRALQQGYKTITLGTDVNMRAFQLYRKHGFEVTSGSTVYRWRKSRLS
jgi:ribosomal protein S18 acetylase RimI-like enzyme